MAINLKREGIALNAEERNKRNENLTIIEQELEKIGSASALAELAKLAADDAKVKTENVQQQVNALTVSGDSSPQATQASVGADGTDYDGNLKARLDAEHNTVTAQLAETSNNFKPLWSVWEEFEQRELNVKWAGAKGDGVTNDTLALQSAFNIGGDIYIPSGTYYFSKLEITKDNTRITLGRNVILKSDSTVSGSLQIRGEEVGPSFPLTADVVEMSRTILLADTSDFIVGDFVFLEQTNPTGSTEMDNKQKFHSCLLEIESKTSMSLNIKQPIPHDFQISNSARVRKIKPVKNVSIVGHDAIFDQMGTVAPNSFIDANYSVGFKVSGFTCENGAGKAVLITKSNHFEIRDIKHRKPTSVAPGYGYGIQIEKGSGYGLIENIVAYDSRHGIDICNGSHDIEINKVTCFNTNINGHGQNTMNITLNDCNVFGQGYSIGNYAYTHDHHWVLTNCKSFNYSLGFNIVNKSYAVKLINCESVKCNTGAICNGANDVLIVNFTSDDSSSRFLEISNGSSNIRLKNVYFKEKAGNIYLYGLYITGDSFNVTVDGLSGELKNITDAIRISNSSNFESDVTILNSNLESKSSGKSVNITGGIGVRLQHSEIKSGIFANVSEKIFIIGNNIKNNSAIDVRTTKNTMILNNFGLFTLSSNTPAHNGNDILVANNLKTIV